MSTLPFLTLLFTVSAGYNLIIGNLANALVSLAMAVFFAGVKIIGPDVENAKPRQYLWAVILVGVPVTIVTSVAFTVLHSVEIGLEKYQQITKIKGDFPELQEIIKKSMDDGKISIPEYHKIEKHYLELAKEREKSLLRE